MDYSAPWWLPGGNLQTIWAALRSRRYLGLAPQFRRERWTTPDHDFVDVDWLVDMTPTLDLCAPTLPTSCGSLDVPTPEALALPPVQTCAGRFGAAVVSPGGALRLRSGEASPAASACEEDGPPFSASGVDAEVAARPLLVVFHGLEGSSESHYAEAFADVARSRGWACAIPHFRGCSGELNLAPRAYHSGDFVEIDWMLSTFAQRHHGPIVAVGVSLGGNALMRWAAEMESAARQRVVAVASVCSPLDLAASGWAIGRGFNRLVYTRMFLSSMVPKALDKLAQHPGLFDRERLLAARDLHEFDNIFTAPLHGFRDTDDYWARASAKPHLHRVQLPALALNAANDPFVPAFSLPTAADVSSHVTLWQPAQGGHVGFPSAPFPGHVRAMPEAVASYFAQHLRP